MLSDHGRLAANGTAPVCTSNLATGMTHLPAVLRLMQTNIKQCYEHSNAYIRHCWLHSWYQRESEVKHKCVSYDYMSLNRYACLPQTQIYPWRRQSTATVQQHLARCIMLCLLHPLKLMGDERKGGQINSLGGQMTHRTTLRSAHSSHYRDKLSKLHQWNLTWGRGRERNP